MPCRVNCAEEGLLWVLGAPAAGLLALFLLLLALGIVYAQLYVLGCLAHLLLGREDDFRLLERLGAHVDFVFYLK